jgi:hypothetical protein
MTVLKPEQGECGVTDGHQIDLAAEVLADLLGEERRSGDVVEAMLRAFGRFAVIRFAVPKGPDIDGLLFQYGTYSFTGRPMFTLDLLRQFELRDQRGEYEAYRQVGYELLLEPTDRLSGLGRWESWWFDRPDAEDDLESWLAEVRFNSVWTVARSEAANEIVIIDELT